MTEQGRAGPGSLPPRLEVRGLGKRFGAVAALEAIDFVAGRGEVHALTGANGAGKSTLMNLLAGVHAPVERVRVVVARALRAQAGDELVGHTSTSRPS